MHGAAGFCRFWPPFLVDNKIIAPYPDLDSAKQVLDVGLPLFETLATCKFNSGSQKTATMACFDAARAKFHVDSYKVLGIDMGFSKRLDIVCALGGHVFE